MITKYRRKNQSEGLLMKEDTFIRHAMVVTSVSILLEIFGHLYISLVTSFGYVFYCVE